MIKYLKEKIRKHKEKRTFKEYGFKIKSFDLPHFGKIRYAQWLHPSETEKYITESNIHFYQKLSKDGGFIIDIGAHTGDTTVPMALAVGKDGLVLALEPNKYVYAILEKNSKLNSEQTNIHPVDFAATDEDGIFTFNYSDASFCNGGYLSKINSTRHRHNYTLDVQGRNFENYLFENYSNDLPRLDLIKVDAEGYDKEILKTIPKIIKHYTPHILVECYKHLTLNERLDLLNTIEQHGYELYRLEDFTTLNNLVKLNKSNMTEKKHFEMLAVHRDKKAVIFSS